MTFLSQSWVFLNFGAKIRRSGILLLCGRSASWVRNFSLPGTRQSFWRTKITIKGKCQEVILLIVIYIALIGLN